MDVREPSASIPHLHCLSALARKKFEWHQVRHHHLPEHRAAGRQPSGATRGSSRGCRDLRRPLAGVFHASPPPFIHLFFSVFPHSTYSADSIRNMVSVLPRYAGHPRGLPLCASRSSVLHSPRQGFFLSFCAAGGVVCRNLACRKNKTRLPACTASLSFISMRWRVLRHVVAPFLASRSWRVNQPPTDSSAEANL